MSAIEKTAPELDTRELRARAEEFLSEAVPPRYEVIQQSSHAFSCGLWKLIELLSAIVCERPDDVPSQVARAGVGEAQRRLDLIERPGLQGEFERVKRLARSVIALCDHHAFLSGMVLCVACDKPLEPSDEALPYDQVSPSGGAHRSGLVHAKCAQRVRPH